MKKSVKYGGQALLEGVMMQGEHGLAVAVRDSEGVIRTKTERNKKPKSIFYKIPVVRGVFYFVRSLTTGIRVLTDSARVVAAEEAAGEDDLGFAMTVAVVLAIAFSVGLFILLPNILTNFIIKIFKLSISDVGKNMIEGAIKIFIFILYLVIVGLLKDIKRTFMYHGAEHRVINAYERGLDLTVENVQKMPTFHPRCGTSFMFFVLAISIIVFSLFSWQTNPLLRLGLRVLLLPLVAGLSYEFLKLLALSNSMLLLPFKAPGFLLQKLSTKKPDDSMAEVAIAAFNKVRAIDLDPELPVEDFVLPKPLSLVKQMMLDEYNNASVEQGNDINWILADVLNCKLNELSEDKIISAKMQDRISAILARRKTGEPLQYILGYTEFYGLKIRVAQGVLIPRPETELLAEEVIKSIAESAAAQTCPSNSLRVLDLCTGSGCIAIATAKNTVAEVVAADISDRAITQAGQNASENGTKLELVKSNMFDDIEGRFDIIVSNPPYIKTADLGLLQREVTFEPIEALDGGQDGLEFYRIIARNAVDRLNEGGKIFLEVGFGQAGEVSQLLKDAGLSDIKTIKDYSNIDRIVSAKC